MQYRTPFLLSLCLFLLFSGSACERSKADNRTDNPTAKPRNGDIIFQNAQSSQCEAIRRATGSEWTHVGIIFRKNDQLFVYEAVQPVKVTPLEKWIQRGLDEKYVIKRLANADKLLTPAVLERMEAVGKRHLGKNYDSFFEWSDSRMYCSELVWKIYNEALGVEIGKRRPLRDFHLDDPIVRKTLLERYGINIPLDEPMISPGDMFDSDLLHTVAEAG